MGIVVVFYHRPTSPMSQRWRHRCYSDYVITASVTINVQCSSKLVMLLQANSLLPSFRHQRMHSGNWRLSCGCHMSEYYRLVYVHVSRWLPWQRHVVHGRRRVHQWHVHVWRQHTVVSQCARQLQVSVQGGLQEKGPCLHRWVKPVI